MILEACNTSTAIYIKITITAFEAIFLHNFLGHNLSVLGTTALKFIEIMTRGYALPSKQDISLLLKAQKTESYIFNRNIINLYKISE